MQYAQLTADGIYNNNNIEPYVILVWLYLLVSMLSQVKSSQVAINKNK